MLLLKLCSIESWIEGGGRVGRGVGGALVARARSCYNADSGSVGLGWSPRLRLQFFSIFIYFRCARSPLLRGFPGAAWWGLLFRFGALASHSAGSLVAQHGL